MNFKNLLEETIQKSSKKRVLEFAIDICERQKKDYSNFSSLSGFGNPSKIEAVVNKLKTEELLDVNIIEKTISELEEICPDTEDFQITEVSYALNCVTSIIDLLNFIKTHNQEYILNISTYYLDTIDFKIYEAEEKNEKVGAGMEVEMKRQLDFLSNGL